MQYKLRGGWIVKDGKGDEIDYRYNRKMMYEFN